MLCPSRASISTGTLFLCYGITVLNIGASCCHCLPSMCRWKKSKAIVSRATLCNTVLTLPALELWSINIKTSISLFSWPGRCVTLLGPPTGHQFTYVFGARKLTGDKKKRLTIQGSSTVECIWYLWKVLSIILGTQHSRNSCQLLPIASAHTYSKKTAHSPSSSHWAR